MRSLIEIAAVWIILQGVMIISQRFGLPQYCTGLVATLLLIPLVLHHEQKPL